MDTDEFRHVLGHFCTGVTVVTALEAGEPIGFACQAFAALSLVPPLVLFCPAAKSYSWQRIKRVDQFAVNVLAADQQDVSRVFGTSGANKFAPVSWSLSSAGSPIIDGALTWIDCTITSTIEAGDHYIVVGEVTTLGPVRGGAPLLFYRGRYTSPQPEPAGPPEMIDTLLAWPGHADWL